MQVLAKLPPKLPRLLRGTFHQLVARFHVRQTRPTQTSARWWRYPLRPLSRAALPAFRPLARRTTTSTLKVNTMRHVATAQLTQTMSKLSFIFQIVQMISAKIHY